METAVLWNQYKVGPSPELKKQIVIRYIKLVHYVIHNSKFIDYNILDERDFFQFGIEGLSEAIDRFDPDFGTKFETYAIQRIRGKIIDELRKLSIKPRVIPSNSNEDIVYSNVSLNNPVNEEDNYLLYEIIPDDSEIPDVTLEKNEAKEMLIKAIKKLDERDRLIITLYYYENLNYKDIAKVLGITVSRVSQVHSRIISILKSSLLCLNEF
jgi:RNA polymerase sigma factor for flagellar operon FliA